MRTLEMVASRLARSDMLQAAALLLVALCFTVAIQWPVGSVTVNEAWFSVAPVRLTLLSIGAMAWGAGLGARARPGGRTNDQARYDLPARGTSEWRSEGVATIGALLALVVVTLPFELVTHAASYPDVSLAWSLAVPALAVFGYFGAGLLLGRAAASLHVTFLLALLVPLLFAGAAWLDVSFGHTLLNPWTATLYVSTPYVAALGALACVTLLTLVGRMQRATGAASEGAPTS